MGQTLLRQALFGMWHSHCKGIALKILPILLRVKRQHLRGCNLLQSRFGFCIEARRINGIGLELSQLAVSQFVQTGGIDHLFSQQWRQIGRHLRFRQCNDGIGHAQSLQGVRSGRIQYHDALRCLGIQLAAEQ